MHLYARAVGLSEISSRSAIETLLTTIKDDAIRNNSVICYSEGESQDSFYEAQIDYCMLKRQNGTEFEDMGGLVIRGFYNPEDKIFEQTFYFPYIKGNVPRYNREMAVERQTDKEAYLAHCDEPRREVPPIFFVKNIVEYLNKTNGRRILTDRFVYLSALSTSGKIILPIRQTKAQIDRCKAATNKRNKLVDMAMKGNPDAIDNLTIGDYDMLSDICQRIRKEDIYTIVNSSFIPSGLECDHYTVVGNIMEVTSLTNEITGEEIYYMLLECNDNMINLGINRKDLYGIPQVGFRFSGRIWLQGDIELNAPLD